MSKFDDFLLAEYEHIADAHFETGKQVATFFNYYLLILAAPVVILSLVQGKELGKVIAPQGGDELLIHSFVIFILVIISIVGYCISWIVIELQHDAILYARTVNGIRAYFYSKAAEGKNGMTPEQETQIRVLPKKVNQPDFKSYGHLGIIVFAFAFINTAFLTAAIFVYTNGSMYGINWLFAAIAFSAHFVTHSALSKRKEKAYSAT